MVPRKNKSTIDVRKKAEKRQATESSHPTRGEHPSGSVELGHEHWHRETLATSDRTHLAGLDLALGQHLLELEQLRNARNDRVALHRRRRNNLFAHCERTEGW